MVARERPKDLLQGRLMVNRERPKDLLQGRLMVDRERPEGLLQGRLMVDRERPKGLLQGRIMIARERPKGLLQGRIMIARERPKGLLQGRIMVDEEKLEVLRTKSYHWLNKRERVYRAGSWHSHSVNILAGQPASNSTTIITYYTKTITPIVINLLYPYTKVFFNSNLK